MDANINNNNEGVPASGLEGTAWQEWLKKTKDQNKSIPKVRGVCFHQQDSYGRDQLPAGPHHLPRVRVQEENLARGRSSFGFNS